MKKIMLFNVVEPEEERVAILNDGLLDELYIERTEKHAYLGNIYKGRVTNVEPGIQAAFVEFGGDKQGFIHVSDILPSIGREGSGPPQRRQSRHRRTALLSRWLPGVAWLLRVARLLRVTRLRVGAGRRTRAIPARGRRVALAGAGRQ